MGILSQDSLIMRVLGGDWEKREYGKRGGKKSNQNRKGEMRRNPRDYTEEERVLYLE